MSRSRVIKCVLWDRLIDPACPVILSVMFSLYREEAVCEALSICSQSDLDAIREHFSFIGADYDDWKEWC